jgi:hypothetical protein
MLFVQSLGVSGEKNLEGKIQVPGLDFLRSLKTNWQMTDEVYRTGIQYLDSNSDMRDKLGNVCSIKSTGKLNWWLQRITGNMVQLKHFKEKDKHF